MKVELEMWHLVLLMLAFFGCVAGFGKILLDQVEKRLAERFNAQEKASEKGQSALRQSLELHIEEERRNSDALRKLEHDFLEWKADLPIHYVRREDYVRGQSVIEAKLDAVYSKLEVVQINGAKNG